MWCKKKAFKLNHNKSFDLNKVVHLVDRLIMPAKMVAK